MKLRKKLIIGITVLAITGIIIQTARAQRSHRRLATIADEGYEMAEDILYPLKPKRRRMNS